MPDPRAPLRSLSFTVVAAQLGWDIAQFRRSKQDWVGPCHLHGSKTNHNCFRYHDSGKFHCFSCSAKGSGAIDLVKAARGCSFTEAVGFLKPLLSVQPMETPANEKSPVVANSGATELKPYTGKYEKFQVPCPWLEARIPDPAIREKYGVFCYENPARKSAYSGRVMIPVKDLAGVLYGYMGRHIADNADTTLDLPKYLFPRGLEKSRYLFGAYELRQHLSGISSLPSSRYAHVYLLESPFAVMKFASLGLPAVSPFGWSVSNEQLEILSQLSKGCVYLPDRNKWDNRYREVTALAQHMWVRCPELPACCDDPEFLSKEQIFGLAR